jgi:hypothetical protein
MNKMTWRELKNFINKQARNNKHFLDETVNIFDYATGELFAGSLTELLVEATENMDTGWVAYIAINEQELENEKAKEASVD